MTYFCPNETKLKKMYKSTITLLIVTGITAISLIGVLIKQKTGFGPFSLKVYGLTLVIGIGAIITVSDVQTDRLTAFFGILGAIAGYLFGLGSNSKNEQTP